MKYLDTNPNPAALLSSLRDIGYNVETAIEDLIDNSITAKSSRIEIQMIWNSGKPWMGILDDGKGMSSEELVKAMTLAGNNPLDQRDKDDLGRFGLGLKTASFSQCKELTVITFNNENLTAAVLDLEEIEKNSEKGFRVGILDKSDIESIQILDEFPDFLSSKQGTVVLWQNMDRVDSFDKSQSREKKFNSMKSSIKSRIQLTFHRFLKYEPGHSAIQIVFNNDEIKHIDPFNEKAGATIELPLVPLKLKTYRLEAQAYILPHHSKVSEEDYKKHELPGGYFMNQGLFVYRNRRLITRGTWLRLTHRSELTKLVRVRVDIPNNLDDLLRVNVMKSSLILPETIKDQFSKVLEQIRNAGVQVYHKRAKRVISEVSDPMWIRNTRDGKISYEINQDNRLITSITDNLNDDQSDKFSMLIRSLECCFPTMPLFNDLANNPSDLEQPSISDEELKRVLDLFKSDIVNNDLNIDSLIKIEPFASNKSQVKKLIKDLGI